MNPEGLEFLTRTAGVFVTAGDVHWSRVVFLFCLFLWMVIPGLRMFRDTLREVQERSGEDRLEGVRMAFVHLLIGVVILTSLYDMAANLSHWPFSSFPMYSGRYEETAVWIRPYAVTRNGTEFPLTRAEQINRTNPRFLGMLRSPDAGKKILAYQSDIVNRYRKRRKSGTYGGPEVIGIRIYRTVWNVREKSPLSGSPEKKELIFDGLHEREEGS